MIKNRTLNTLPLGAVKPKGYLLTQCNLQAKNITGNMENYPEFSAKSGWLGGDGESWERGTYYTRGLVALAYTLNDDCLITKARKWINWSLNSQKENGDFGANTDMWAKMPMLMAIRDYYLAELYLGNEDKRVLPFLQKYFMYQAKWRKFHRFHSWAKARGADNIEVVLWYRDVLLTKGSSEKETAWLINLANKLLKCTQDWEKEMRNGGKLRYHVVNTTQGYKQPYVKYLLKGDETMLESLHKGLEAMRGDHGRIDNLPNADEAARDNLPTRGTETCAVVEGMLSFEIGGAISGDSRLYDLLESYAYNNLPNCFDYEITTYCYFQLQNQVLATHGQHGFVNDHGDSSAYGIGAFECCFSNLHMGYPKFVQNMYALKESKLVVCAYGENELNTVIDGKKIIFEQKTNYPYGDKITLAYRGEPTRLTTLFRVPSWSKNVKINNISLLPKNGFVEFSTNLTKGDIINVEFSAEIKVLSWHHNSKYVQRGCVLYCLPIKEEWRETKDYSTRGVKYDAIAPSKNYEIYPKEDWNYTFVDYSNEVTYNENFNSASPISQDNAPCYIEGKFLKVNNWGLNINICDTVEKADLSNVIEYKRLIPTAFSRLKISVFPNADTATCEQNNSVIKHLTLDLKDVQEVDNVEMTIEKSYKLLSLTFAFERGYDYAIVWGYERNTYDNIKNIKINSYVFGHDPYGSRIKKEKIAFEIEEKKNVYFRLLLLKNTKSVKKTVEKAYYNC